LAISLVDTCSSQKESHPPDDRLLSGTHRLGPNAGTVAELGRLALDLEPAYSALGLASKLARRALVLELRFLNPKESDFAV
jgi:hypothetical protein